MAPELLSREEFVAWLSGKLEQAGLCARYDAEAFCLLYHGGTLALHTLFASYCERDDAGRALLLDEILGSLPASEPCLVPRLRVEETRLRGSELPHRLLTDNVALTLTRGPLSVPFETALEAALEQLIRQTVELPRRLAAGLYTGNWDDFNHSARIVLVPAMGLELAGDPVVLVPTRETLLITGTGETEGLTQALDRASRAQGHAVTVVPLRWTGASWARLELAPGHPLAARVRRLAFEDRHQEYAEQKGLLDALFRLQGESVKVASYQGYRVSGELISLATFVEGVETLLPEVDRVRLVDDSLPDEDRVVDERPWAELRASLGERMQLTEHWPPRWRVTRWRS